MENIDDLLEPFEGDDLQQVLDQIEQLQQEAEEPEVDAELERMIDEELEDHEEDCPAVDGFGCRCGE